MHTRAYNGEKFILVANIFSIACNVYVRISRFTFLFPQILLLHKKNYYLSAIFKFHEHYLLPPGRHLHKI